MFADGSRRWDDDALDRPRRFCRGYLIPKVSGDGVPRSPAKAGGAFWAKATIGTFRRREFGQAQKRPSALLKELGAADFWKRGLKVGREYGIICRVS